MNERKKSIHEQLLKKTIKMQIDKIELPKNEKQNNWEKIQRELTLSDSKPRTSKKRFVVVSLVASLLISIVAIYVVGPTTQIMTGTQTQHLTPDDFIWEIDDSIVFHELESREFTIEQAQEIANFDIIIPVYIPNNFDLQYVVSPVSEIYYRTNHITLHYESEDMDYPLTIEQQYYGKGFTLGMTVDHEDTKIEHLTIDNKTITLFTFKDGKLLLWLELPHMLVSIRGFIDRDEIFRIAQSMI
ncbi:DUF4367 domain-containing protein [Desulfuribacillus alkaliarsenatis]|uniref:DUF4367 domain-containing protein n=1 Tax=Desulfuribacillus alkaliarsenatis TaxID=766136 RepID=A0A1E5FZW4_9FIRM|nr:DUF4367 domain-containing protein [Desulfuribacillus alkaliarsenatis]OEF96121.1 hypothetical protein BHF68_10340 [Desulfuribacillus alkaliarsenatis]